MTLEERLRGVRRFQPELCSLNMGSMNFGLYPMIDAIKEFAATTGSGRILEGTRS